MFQERARVWPFKSRQSGPPVSRIEPSFRNGPENPDWLGNMSDQAVTDFFKGLNPGTFGPAVNEQSAMQISTVFACVKLAADVVSSAPLGVYEDSPNGARALKRNHRLYKLLHVCPFPGRPMTSATWRQLWIYHVWLWGNHYSRIHYDGAGRAYGFEPLLPWCVETIRQGDGTNLYRVRENGTVKYVLPQDEVLHFSGPSFTGVVGLSRIQQFARDAVALAAVMQEQTGRVHENAARPSGMLTFPPNITKEGKERLESHWTQRFTGRANAGAVVFADKDSTFTPFQMSPEDLGTLEARRFQSVEICRIFGTPPHLVHEAAGTSAWGTGIEQLTLGYKQFTIHPQMFDFEQELALKLFDGTPYYPQFDRTALVVMDAKTTAEVSQTEINSGVLTIDERRAQLGRPPVEGGDQPMVNAALTSLKLAQTAKPTPATSGGTPSKDKSNAS